MPGIEAQHLMAEALGFLRLPGAKLPEGRAEHLGAGRGAECARCGRTGAAPLLLALFLGRASFLAIHDSRRVVLEYRHARSSHIPLHPLIDHARAHVVLNEPPDVIDIAHELRGSLDHELARTRQLDRDILADPARPAPPPRAPPRAAAKTPAGGGEKPGFRRSEG